MSKESKEMFNCGSAEHQVRNCPLRKEDVGQSSQENPSIQCWYCGKSNHQKSECWKKTDKCLRCESLKYKIRKYPLIKENPMLAS